MVWPFSSSSKSNPAMTPIDEKVPPPPHGSYFVPPPDKPNNLRGKVDDQGFSGFSPLPTNSNRSTTASVSSPVSSGSAASYTSSSGPSFHSKGEKQPSNFNSNTSEYFTQENEQFRDVETSPYPKIILNPRVA
eukprot:GHVR01171419.1.p1 GENE.GHVR01171419.1~~GHVR01171419.1.p1  ORF type:complete len:149 (+),score=32.29 GHVR01171419.1:50-448(+)